MAKKVDPIKAKEAKQKKIAIGGFVLLLLVLGIQGPKTLKMLKGPQREAPVAASSTTPAATTPAVPIPGSPEPAVGTAAGEAPAAAVPELASVADSDPAPAAEAGQLATFERFASKDPFAQQAEAVTKPAGSGKPAAPEGEDPAAGDKPDGSTPTPGKTGTTDGGFTSGGSTPAPPAERAAATSIAVNGVAEDVKVEATFPALQPTFVLVSLAADGKSVEVGIAGGAYANGGDTLKLTFGKKVTLQNTADGSSYELELLTIEGFAPPKKK